MKRSGRQLVAGTDQLAPTRAFGRALLGGVGPATAEQLEESRRRRYAPGDEVGQWGLQEQYEKRLAGMPERRS